MTDHFFISPPLTTSPEEIHKAVQRELKHAKAVGLFAYYLPDFDRALISGVPIYFEPKITLDLNSEQWSHLN